jgi:hypothetical protein
MSHIKIVSTPDCSQCHEVYIDGVKINGVYEATLKVGLFDKCPSLELKVRATNNLVEVDGIVYAEVENPQIDKKHNESYADIDFLDSADKERLLNGDRTD